jgi:hypothetical protein
MTETGNNTQKQKKKTSKLVICAAILCILGIVHCLAHLYMIGGLLLLIGLNLGVTALVRIKTNKQLDDEEIKMKESNKRIWIARLLALVIMSLLTSFVFHPAAKKITQFENNITIRVNGDIGDIIASVEALGREDIEIITKKQWVLGEGDFHMVVISMFVLFGVILSIYHIIYGVLLALMPIKRVDKPIDSFKMEQ